MRLKDNYDLEANLELRENNYKLETFEKNEKNVSPLQKYRKK